MYQMWHKPYLTAHGVSYWLAASSEADCRLLFDFCLTGSPYAALKEEGKSGIILIIDLLYPSVDNAARYGPEFGGRGLGRWQYESRLGKKISMRSENPGFTM